MKQEGMLLAVLLGVALLLCGCLSSSGEAWQASFSAGLRAYDAGRYGEAAQLFAAASKKATRVKDRDESLFMQARMYGRAGRDGDAKKSYEALLALSPDGLRACRAAIERARLMIRAGDARGWDLVAEAIARWPNDGAARSAVMDWVEHLRKTGGEEKVRTAVEPLIAKVTGSEAEQHLEYELGLSLARSGKLAEAHAALVDAAVRHPYPFGALTDDALWHASLVAEREGDVQLAIADLRRMLAVREVADNGQSYERPKFPTAQMRIAELYRDKLGDLGRAREEFARVWREHPTSLLADDAAWQQGVMSVRLGEPEEACRAARVLLARFSGSRYIGCVKALCPSAEEPKGARDCPHYILAELAPGALEPKSEAPDPEARGVE